MHICLRARDPEIVRAFHAAALAAGGADAGAPGPRKDENDGYHASYIRDLDGDLIEAVTFIRSE